ncbi:MAG: hypothetical protein AAGC93_12135, partial [Cyanobacteria bacterium P01_F01_bin.53]
SNSYVDLPTGICGKGVPGLVDDPAFSEFWTWRDRLYNDFRKVRSNSGPGGSGPSASAPTTGPVAIGID